MSVTLYNYYRSSASWRVRIGLNLKGIAYEYRAVNLIADGGQQHAPEHRQRNPMRELPTLEIDGRLISQSVAILEYLDQTRPTPPLLPTDPYQRALSRQLTEIINASIQPAQNLRILKYLETNFGADPAARTEWARHWIDYGFGGLEGMLARTAGTYSVGEAVSIADLFLVPQVYNARRYGVDLAPFPTIVRVEAALLAIEAFAAAHPDRQPDAPAT